MFQTRFTEMFGIQYPLMQGALGYLSMAELVSAVSNAGALGTLALAGVPSGSELRDEIRKIKDMTDRPFAANIPMLPGLRKISLEEMADIIVEEAVPIVETVVAGRIPNDILSILKQGGVKIIHKCTKVKHAKSAEEQGVDAVAILSFGADGHPGQDEIAPLVQIPMAAETLSIPIIAAGSIADARGFVAALALGADAVLMGTRYLTAKECPIHNNIRDRLLQAEETDTVIVGGGYGLPSRRLKNKPALEAVALEKEGAPLEEVVKVMSGERAAVAWREGEVDGGVFGCGQVIGLINDIRSAKEITERIIDEAKTLIAKLGKMSG
jgi:nitronate monooxygenase